MISDIERIRQQAMFDLMSGTGGGGYSADPGGGGGGQAQSVSQPQYQQDTSGYDYQDPFGTYGIEPPTVEAPQAPNTMSPETLDWLRKYQEYKPDTVAMDRLNKLLEQAPDISDYQPSLGRKIVAGGLSVGKGSLKEGMDFLNDPYIRAEQQFKDRATPFETAAARENTSNTNQRQFLSQMATAQTNADKAREIAQKDRETATNTRLRDQAKAENDAKKNEILDAAANKATVDFKGKYVRVSYPDGRFEVSDVLSSSFDPIERANIDAASREKVAGINAQARIDAKTAEPGVNPNAPGGLLSGKDQVQARQDRFEELYNTTDLGRKWIQKDDNGKYTMKDKPVPGSMPWSDTQKEVDEWQSVANGIYTNPVVTKAQSAKRGTSGANPTPPPEAQQTVVPTKKAEQDAGIQAGTLLLVQDPSGQKHVIPANKPVPKGWTKVAR